MKPLHIAIGIGGIAVVVLGVMALRSKLEYNRDVSEISNLLGEIKASGAPTNIEDYSPRIPDSQNAWVELNSVYLPREGEAIFVKFCSPFSAELISYGTQATLPTIRNYVTFNQKWRTDTEKILTKKSKLQLPLEFTFGTSLPRSNALRGLAESSPDYCLAALQAAYDNQGDDCIRQLSSAIRISNELFRMNQKDSVYFGVTSQLEIYRTVFHIAEQNPTLGQRARELIQTPSQLAHTDLKKVLDCEFLKQITLLRQHDDPSIDKSTLPYPLSLLQNLATGTSTSLDRQLPVGDTIPRSKKVRQFFIERLRIWKDLTRSLRTSNVSEMIPTVRKSLSKMEMWRGAPEAITDPKIIGEEMSDDQENWNDRLWTDANTVIWQLIDQKQKSGKFPTSQSNSQQEQTKVLTFAANQNSVAFVSKTKFRGRDVKLGFPMSLIRAGTFEPVNDASIQTRIKGLKRWR